MDKLEKLTPEQEALMSVVRQDWLDNIFKPSEVNQDVIKEGVKWLYGLCKLKEPVIVFVDSPFGAQLAANYLKQIVKDPSVWDSVRASVRDSVSDSVWASVSDSVWASVWASVRASVRDSVSASVWDSVSASVWDSVRASVRDSVSDSVWASVSASVRASVSDSVSASVWDSVSASVRDSVSDSVWDSVSASVSDSVWDSVSASVWDSVSASVSDSKLEYFPFSYYYNISDYGWVAFYDFFTRIGILDYEPFNKYLSFLKAGVYDCIMLKGICIVSTLPQYVLRDERGRLHSTERPAIEWADTYKLYFIDGVSFPEKLWLGITQNTISAKEVIQIENQEQKTIALRLIGYDKVIKELGGKVIASHKITIKNESKVYEVVEVDLGDDNVPARFVKVVCHSVLKETVLRVNPRSDATKDPIGAIASTFGFTKKQYKLILET